MNIADKSPLSIPTCLHNQSLAIVGCRHFITFQSLPWTMVAYLYTPSSINHLSTRHWSCDLLQVLSTNIVKSKKLATHFSSPDRHRISSGGVTAVNSLQVGVPLWVKAAREKLSCTTTICLPTIVGAMELLPGHFPASRNEGVVVWSPLEQTSIKSPKSPRCRS